MQEKCPRNRKRSKRRAIFCPVHGCYLDSVSQKYRLFADQAKQLQQQGMGRRNALLLIASQTTVPLDGEWLEAFWCDQCQETKWYHVRKELNVYKLSVAPLELWQQAQGAISPYGNPSVSEFSRRQSRMLAYKDSKNYSFVG